MYRSFFKPLFDRTGAFLALIVLSPVLLVVAIMVRIKLGSPIIFSQIRPGKDEKPFKLYKFRTMIERNKEEDELADDSARLTNFGNSLRRTSLDELPELFNILVGDMSFVGPRPLLMQYLPLYDDLQRRRHEVKPGLTGLAQVKGRNSISWEKKFELDIHYVDEITFIGDLKIVLYTSAKVLLRENINAENSVTMEPFMGTAPGLEEDR
jgi:undecaprenyl phosphate N,N'-diacetylbacillosamine 1-phosphate transferase